MADNLQVTIVDSSEKTQEWPLKSSAPQTGTQEVNSSGPDVDNVSQATKPQTNISSHYDADLLAETRESQPKHREFSLLRPARIPAKESYNRTSDFDNTAITVAPGAQFEIQDASPSCEEAQGVQRHEDLPPFEESTAVRLQRLGRQRPNVFNSVWSEMGFVFSISMSQVLSVSDVFSSRIYSLMKKGIFRLRLHRYPSHAQS
jgi:hypothetical protein